MAELVERNGVFGEIILYIPWELTLPSFLGVIKL